MMKSKGLYLLWLLAILLIACLDYMTGKELVVWVLYLLPIGVASWVQGVRTGIALSLIGGPLILAVGLVAGHSFNSLAYFMVAIVNRMLAMLVVAWLASHLYRKQMLESTLESYQQTLDYYHLSPLSRAKVHSEQSVVNSDQADLSSKSH